MTLEIANKLISLRRARGVSQEELAAVIGVSRQAISKWERGEASPDIDNIILLSRFYGVSINELLCCGEEYEPVPVEPAPEVLHECAEPEPIAFRAVESVPEEGLLFSSVSEIICAARADLELFGVEGSEVSVALEGSEREREECAVFTDGSVLHIETPKNERRLGFFFRRSTLKIIVGVPERLRRVSLELSGGDAEIRNVSVMDQFVRTGGGDISMTGSDSKGLTLQTGGGDITVSDSRAEEAQIRTGGGDIDIEGLGVTGRAELHTGGGDLKAELSAGEVCAVAGGGDITISGRAGGVEARSGGGDVSVTVDGALSVCAKSGGGDVELAVRGASGAQVSLATAGGDAELRAFGERIGSGKRVEATVGDGSVKVELKSAGGDVTAVIS